MACVSKRGFFGYFQQEFSFFLRWPPSGYRLANDCAINMHDSDFSWNRIQSNPEWREYAMYFGKCSSTIILP